MCGLPFTLPFLTAGKVEEHRSKEAHHEQQVDEEDEELKQFAPAALEAYRLSRTIRRSGTGTPCWSTRAP